MGDQLIGLADQVELEERLRVLVASKLLVDLPLDLLGPVQFILADRQVTIGLIAVIVRVIAQSLFLGELVDDLAC